MIFKFKKKSGGTTSNFRMGFTPTPIGIGVSSHSERGFTLVELIVSLALFIIVIFIVTSSFLNIVHLYEKAQTVRIALDTMSIAVENMARSLRTGSQYYCNADSNFANRNSIPLQDCPAGDISIMFIDPTGAIGGYQLKTDSTHGYIQWRDPARTNQCCEVLTGNDINITNLTFYTFNAATVGPEQPRISFVVQGTAGTDPQTRTKFSIYTSVTQRIPK